MKLHKSILIVICAVLAAGANSPATYVLGPDDQIKIVVVDVEEVGSNPLRIDLAGNVNVPLAGRIHAGGLTVPQLEAEVVARLRKYVHEPQVTISVTEFRSQPVSVLGAVNKPGIHQLHGRKTLYEVLSVAEGLRNDAGNTIKITRQSAWGEIPLSTAVMDKGKGFSVAEVAVNSVMEAKNPQENIVIMPNDVISVPRAAVVYVVGNVKKSGAFVLGEKSAITALQALALAEGLDVKASPGHAKIFRSPRPSGERVEEPVNLKKLLAGKGADVKLYPDDILFVPNSAARAAGFRALETAVQLGTGVLIWR